MQRPPRNAQTQETEKPNQHDAENKRADEILTRSDARQSLPPWQRIRLLKGTDRLQLQNFRQRRAERHGRQTLVTPVHVLRRAPCIDSDEQDGDGNRHRDDVHRQR